MLSKISNLMVSREILLKNFKTIDLKIFTRSRAYSAYFGVDLSGFNTLIFMREASSHFIMRDSEFLLTLTEQICANLGKTIKKRVLFHNSQICSKSKKFLEENGFKTYAFM
ncbi:hypothetical protein OFO03_07640 [Campylobacter sp. JMF_02 ED1]|uniref:hypothetical protein n=1 Tax=unclassified Campylobacter TaxID=2593542 RepID=UPI0022E9CE45|nr:MULTISPECIES: hypothetical protein [unclassified Campylobacter]MDA3050082.1 hypothetical protein [Campylobacter sp. JMF_15 NE4]MDA3051772.1 hypothetical protein [Campylobacter sp. JMF_02 ED1]